MFIQYFSSISSLFYSKTIIILVITKKDHMCNAWCFFLPLNYNWYRWCCTHEKRGRQRRDLNSVCPDLCFSCGDDLVIHSDDFLWSCFCTGSSVEKCNLQCRSYELCMGNYLPRFNTMHTQEHFKVPLNPSQTPPSKHA